MPNKFFRYTLILGAFFLIICIRFFEDVLFYDPFLTFFKTDYQNKSLPNVDALKLISNLFLRYFANTLLSIAIIYLLFLNQMHVKVAFILYLILFVLLLAIFSYLLFVSKEPNYLVLFYVRRFLIQPMLLLLLIPAFYFQKLTSK
jgi:exosortase F-associated protein